MRFRLQLITVGEDGSERMHSVAELERDSTLRLETTGLTLAEGKQGSFDEMFAAAAEFEKIFNAIA
jgi:hypothetical protein